VSRKNSRESKITRRAINQFKRENATWDKETMWIPYFDKKGRPHYNMIMMPRVIEPKLTFGKDFGKDK